MNYKIIIGVFNRAAHIHLIQKIAQTSGDYSALNEMGGDARVEQLFQHYLKCRAEYIDGYEQEFAEAKADGIDELEALAHIKRLKGE